jgi:hypothetical protein
MGHLNYRALIVSRNKRRTIEQDVCLLLTAQAQERGARDMSIICKQYGDPMRAASSTDGTPVNPKMRSSWFIVDFPGNMGRPVRSSPRMQPQLHMSTPNV